VKERSIFEYTREMKVLRCFKVGGRRRIAKIKNRHSGGCV
jgi:hypothetical protein